MQLSLQVLWQCDHKLVILPLRGMGSPEQMRLRVDPTQDPEPRQMTPKCVPSFGVDARLAKLRWVDARVSSPGGILEEPSPISFCTKTPRAAGHV